MLFIVIDGIILLVRIKLKRVDYIVVLVERSILVDIKWFIELFWWIDEVNFK